MILNKYFILQASWKKLACVQGKDGSESLPPLPSRLVTEDDLKEFYEAMKIYEVPKTGVISNVGIKRKGQSLGGLDTQRYGRGKRAREVCLSNLILILIRILSDLISFTIMLSKI
jgi:hypothetical protein